MESFNKIIYRAKRKDNNEWVEGSLIYHEGCYFIFESDTYDTWDNYLNTNTGCIDGYVTPVIANTIGRLLWNPCYSNYERFKDCRFFQGDIIKLYSRHCEGEQDVGVVIDEHCFLSHRLGYRLDPQDTLEGNIVGNIWDDDATTYLSIEDINRYKKLLYEDNYYEGD